MTFERRKDGRETWFRLRDWDKGQAPSERLAAQILHHQGFRSIDPVHPLGGPDGLKDVKCTFNGATLIAACYFPRGEHGFKEVKKKFEDDVAGIDKNSVEGMVFLTNQELTLGERTELEDSVPGKTVYMFHLERIATILNFPENYGLRLDFLDIEMTKEEQLAFTSLMASRMHDLQNFIVQAMTELVDAKAKEDAPKAALTVRAESVEKESWSPWSKSVHKCSHCGFGYKVIGAEWDALSGTTPSHQFITIDPPEPNRYSTMTVFGQSRRDRKSVTCPKCGNVDSYPAFGIDWPTLRP